MVYGAAEIATVSQISNVYVCRLENGTGRPIDQKVALAPFISSNMEDRQSYSNPVKSSKRRTEFSELNSELIA